MRLVPELAPSARRRGPGTSDVHGPLGAYRIDHLLWRTDGQAARAFVPPLSLREDGLIPRASLGEPPYSEPDGQSFAAAAPVLARAAQQGAACRTWRSPCARDSLLVSGPALVQPVGGDTWGASLARAMPGDGLIPRSARVSGTRTSASFSRHLPMSSRRTIATPPSRLRRF